jgi:hypothetical protein
MRRSSATPNIALDDAILQFDGAAHGVNHAAKFGEESIASSLDHPPVMRGDGGIDQIAAQRSESR